MIEMDNTLGAKMGQANAAAEILGFAAAWAI
jgi:hypothetical protein